MDAAAWAALESSPHGLRTEDVGGPPDSLFHCIAHYLRQSPVSRDRLPQNVNELRARLSSELSNLYPDGPPDWPSLAGQVRQLHAPQIDLPVQLTWAQYVLGLRGSSKWRLYGGVLELRALVTWLARDLGLQVLVLLYGRGADGTVQPTSCGEQGTARVTWHLAQCGPHYRVAHLAARSDTVSHPTVPTSSNPSPPPAAPPSAHPVHSPPPLTPGARSPLRSLPLVLPANCAYDAHSNVVTVRPGSSEGLVVIPQALEFLRSLRGPLAILTVAGIARTGKSYLLSRLLGSRDAFALGPTTDPVTRGVWVGTQTIPCNGYQIVVLDTEGIGAIQGSKERDISVLILSIVLSSYFIYNSFGVPQASQVDELWFVSRLAQSIKTAGSELKDHLPDFMWLLRDAHVTPKLRSGAPCTWPQYLADVVLYVPNPDSVAVEDRSRIRAREGVLRVFRTTDCFALPHPGVSTEEMRRLEDVSDDRLQREFLEAFARLQAHLLARIRVKKAPVVSGGERNVFDVTGPMLASLVEEYVKCVSQPGAIPVLEPMYMQAARAALSRASDAALQLYREEMAKRCAQLPMDTDALLAAHNSAVELAMARITQEVPCAEKGLSKEYVAKLSKQLAEYHSHEGHASSGASEARLREVRGGVLFEWIVRNEEASERQCAALLRELYEPLHRKVLAKEVTWRQFEEAVAALKSEYGRRAVGPAKYRAVAAFVDSALKADEQHLKALEHYEAQVAEELRKRNLAEAQVKVAAERLREIEQQTDSGSLQQKREEIAMLEQQRQMQENVLKEMRANAERERQRSDQFMHAQMKDNEAGAKENAARMQRMTEQLSEMLAATQRAQTESISKLAEQIRTMKPPVVHVKAGGGDCTLL